MTYRTVTIRIPRSQCLNRMSIRNRTHYRLRLLALDPGQTPVASWNRLAQYPRALGPRNFVVRDTQRVYEPERKAKPMPARLPLLVPRSDQYSLPCRTMRLPALVCALLAMVYSPRMCLYRPPPTGSPSPTSLTGRLGPVAVRPNVLMHGCKVRHAVVITAFYVVHRVSSRATALVAQALITTQHSGPDIRPVSRQPGCAVTRLPRHRYPATTPTPEGSTPPRSP